MAAISKSFMTCDLLEVLPTSATKNITTNYSTKQEYSVS